MNLMRTFLTEAVYLTASAAILSMAYNFFYAVKLARFVWILFVVNVFLAFRDFKLPMANQLMNSIVKGVASVILLISGAEIFYLFSHHLSVYAGMDSMLKMTEPVGTGVWKSISSFFGANISALGLFRLAHHVVIAILSFGLPLAPDGDDDDGGAAEDAVEIDQDPPIGLEMGG